MGSFGDIFENDIKGGKVLFERRSVKQRLGIAKPYLVRNRHSRQKSTLDLSKFVSKINCKLVM